MACYGDLCRSREEQDEAYERWKAAKPEERFVTPAPTNGGYQTRVVKTLEEQEAEEARERLNAEHIAAEEEKLGKYPQAA